MEKYKIEQINNKIINGDALQELKKFPDNCIDMVISSPPYWGLRKYLDDEHFNKKNEIGLETSYYEFLDKLIQVMKELKRVIKKTGSIWINFGDSYSKSCMLLQPERFLIRCVDEVELMIINKIIWAKQILVGNNGSNSRYTIGITMPASVKRRFNQSYEYLYFFAKSKDYYSNLDVVKIPCQVQGVTDLRLPGLLRQTMYPNSKYNQIDYSSRFNLRVRDAKRKSGQPGYVANKKESKYKGKFLGMGNESEMLNSPRARAEREEGIKESNNLNKNIPTVWQYNSEPHNFKKELGVDVEHFATFGKNLISVPILFACPPGGIVLDPFMGSGTTALVSQELNRSFVGIEINEDFCKLSKMRLQGNLKINLGI